MRTLRIRDVEQRLGANMAVSDAAGVGGRTRPASRGRSEVIDLL